MMFIMRRRRNKAFTMTELAVVIALFGLFSITAMASLNLTLRHWRTISAQTEVYQNCRAVINTVSKELRMGLPCKAANFESFFIDYGSTPNTYRVTTERIACIQPNRIQDSTSHLKFTEPNPNNFFPSSTEASGAFNEYSTSHYRLVEYFIQNGKELHRKTTFYGAGGASTGQTDNVLAVADTMTFYVTCLSPTKFKIEFSCGKYSNNELKQASLSTIVTVLGR